MGCCEIKQTTDEKERTCFFWKQIFVCRFGGRLNKRFIRVGRTGIRKVRKGMFGLTED